MEVDTKTVCGTGLRRVSHHPAVEAVRRMQSSDAEVWIPLVILIVRRTPDPVQQTFEPFIRPLRRNSHNILITDFTSFVNRSHLGFRRSVPLIGTRLPPGGRPESHDSPNIAHTSPMPQLQDQFTTIADSFDMRRNWARRVSSSKSPHLFQFDTIILSNRCLVIEMFSAASKDSLK
jgi:hypothetical protein